jgi:hypothetical protein
MSDDQQQPADGADHPPTIAGPTEADIRHASRTAATEQHAAAAREHAGILLARVQTLVRNGVDLRDPERLLDLVNDQVIDAVKSAVVPSCCGSEGAAALALLAEMARRCAEATR